jgi:hypothetical protein
MRIVRNWPKDGICSARGVKPAAVEVIGSDMKPTVRAPTHPAPLSISARSSAEKYASVVVLTVAR